MKTAIYFFSHDTKGHYKYQDTKIEIRFIQRCQLDEYNVNPHVFHLPPWPDTLVNIEQFFVRLSRKITIDSAWFGTTRIFLSRRTDAPGDACNLQVLTDVWDKCQMESDRGYAKDEGEVSASSVCSGVALAPVVK